MSAQVLSEKDKLTKKLHSSQLELQQIHTHTTFPPHTPPRQTISNTSHMTTTPNRISPLCHATTSKPVPQDLPTTSQAIATTIKTKNKQQQQVINSTPPKPLPIPTKENRPVRYIVNERGTRELTPHSDDWATLPSVSPQPVTTPLCTHHMPSEIGHMTSKGPVTPIPTPPSLRGILVILSSRSISV